MTRVLECYEEGHGEECRESGTKQPRPADQPIVSHAGVVDAAKIAGGVTKACPLNPCSPPAAITVSVAIGAIMTPRILQI